MEPVDSVVRRGSKTLLSRTTMSFKRLYIWQITVPEVMMMVVPEWMSGVMVEESEKGD